MKKPIKAHEMRLQNIFLFFLIENIKIHTRTYIYIKRETEK